MNSLKDMVSGNKKARFAFFRDGSLYYTTECGFTFPIPTSDTGTGTFNAEEKAISLMRWLRPYRDASVAPTPAGGE